MTRSVRSYDAAADLAGVRTREFRRLDRRRSVYLDFTAAALHPASLVRRHHQRLNRTVLGNPHSAHAASRASARWAERARARILRFFDADPADYDVVFTSNASCAIRLVGGLFPFRADSRLVLTADNHNSVHGLRERARRCGATVHYPCSDAHPELLAALTPVRAPSLLAYPAQSNFSGALHPLSWIRHAQEQGWRVLLDAAAFVPTHAFSLRTHPADFVPVSFYKMFGYPTGVGALVARHDALRLLKRDDFAGGTVEFVSVKHDMHKLRPGAAGLEDGTIAFAALPAIVDGLDWLDQLGMDRVTRHVDSMTARLRHGLRALGGAVELYGPGSGRCGGTICFNVRTAAGALLPYERVERMLSRRRIYVRGGCFCNPGAAERAFGLDAPAIADCLLRFGSRPFVPADLRPCAADRPVGALRASVGIPTTSADVDALPAALLDISRSH